MKKLLLIFLVIPTLALAEEQPKFVPYIVDQDNHAKIMNYLLEQPAKIAIPLIQTFNALEQKAIKEKDEKEKEMKQ
jgi:hypothetical protein